MAYALLSFAGSVRLRTDRHHGPADAGHYLQTKSTIAISIRLAVVENDLHPRTTVRPEQTNRRFRLFERHDVADQRLELDLTAFDQRDRGRIVLAFRHAR